MTQPTRTNDFFTVHAQKTRKRSCGLAHDPLYYYPPILSCVSQIISFRKFSRRKLTLKVPTFIPTGSLLSHNKGLTSLLTQWREELRKPLWCVALCNSRQTAFPQIDQPKCGYRDEFSNLLSQARNSQHTCHLLNE